MNSTNPKEYLDLLKLPAELRVFIFKHYYKSCSETRQFCICEPISNQRPKGCPSDSRLSLLITSKQVRQEALPLYYRYALFKMSYHRTIENPGKLFYTFNHIQRLCVEAKWARARYNGSWSKAVKMFTKSFPCLRKLYLSGLGTAVRGIGKLHPIVFWMENHCLFFVYDEWIQGGCRGTYPILINASIKEVVPMSNTLQGDRVKKKGVCLDVLVKFREPRCKVVIKNYHEYLRRLANQPELKSDREEWFERLKTVLLKFNLHVTDLKQEIGYYADSTNKTVRFRLAQRRVRR